MLFKFINCGTLDDNLKIEIYNKKRKIIISNVHQKVYCCLKNGIYKINLYNNYGYINTYTFIYKKGEVINIYYNYSRIIKFYLTDYYYKNLPIERGEVILWLRT